MDLNKTALDAVKDTITVHVWTYDKPTQAKDIVEIIITEYLKALEERNEILIY